MKPDLWIYEGSPEYIGVRLEPVFPSSHGGYILFLRMVDGSIWIFSSNDPGKCISKWNSTAKRYGMPAIETAMVSVPFLLYTSVKNKIMERLKSYRLEKSGGYQVDLDTLIVEAEKVMEMATPAIKCNGCP